MYKKHRWLGVLIAITMMIGLVPASVFAQEPAPYYAFIPNSGEASVSKVELVSKTEVARYYTEPRVSAEADKAWRTSRIAQDAAGNAYVLNTGADGVNLQGSVARIQVNTTGLITNTDPAVPLAFGTDEAVKVFNVGAPGEIPRAIAVDADGFIWVGFYSGGYLMKYSYNPAGPSLDTVGGPYRWDTDIKFYEMKFAPDGKLWISSRDSTPTVDGTAGVFSFDGATFTREQTWDPYSVLIADDGTVYFTAYSNLLWIRNKDSGVWRSVVITGSSQNRGMGFDLLGNIWIASTVDTSGGTKVYSYNISSGLPGPIYNLTVGTTPVGVGADANGIMWAVCRSDAMPEGYIEGFNPAGPTFFGAIQVGYRPYAYGGFVVPEQPELYKICGFKYNDDTGAPIAGWPVMLYQWIGQDWGAEPIRTVQTDSDGKYCFPDLPAGTYLVKEGAREGWEQVFPDGDGTHSVTLPDKNAIYGISRENTKTIYEIDPITGLSVPVFVPIQNTFNISGPNGLAYDSANDILYYVTYPADNSIDPTGVVRAKLYKLEGGVESFVGDLGQEIACADFYNGKYYYIAGGNIYGPTDDMYEVTFNPDGSAIDHVTSLGSISGDAYSWMFYGDVAIAQDGTLYGSGRNYVNPAVNGEFQFFKVQLDGNGFELINSNLGKPLQLAFGGDGVLYGHNLDLHAYYAVDTVSGTIGDPVSYSDILPGFNDMASGVLYYNFRNRYVVSDICGYKFRAGTTEGLQGWNIELYKWDGAAWIYQKTEATDTDGMYCFEDLPAGRYKVSEVISDQVHWTLISPLSGYHEVLLPDEASDCEAVFSAVAANGANFYNFENEEFFDICGYKLRAGTEEGLEGWTINLYMWDKTLNAGAGGFPTEPTDTTTTDSDGKYCFTGLAVGKYRVAEVIDDPDHWIQVDPEDPGYYDVVLPAGASTTDPETNFRNFTNEELYDICGYKFLSGTTVGLEGWTINLKDVAGALVDTTTTDEDGMYCFNGLVAGTYYVEEVIDDPANWRQTFPLTPDGIHEVVLPDGASICASGVNFYNFENEELYKICGFKYNLDTGEPLEGWRIVLEKWDGEKWGFAGEAFTGLDGKFCFDKLPAGEYRVGEEMQDGWEQVFPAGDGWHLVTLPGGASHEVENVLYGIKRSSGTIYEIDPATGAATEVYQTSIVPTSSVGPNGLAYNSDGEFLYFVSYPGSADLYESSTTPETFIGDLGHEIACADYFDGKYYFIAGGPAGATDDLYEVVFNPDGSIATINEYLAISGNASAWTFSGDIAISPDGTIYGQGLTSGTYEFFMVNRDGTGFEVIRDDYTWSLQLAFGGGGILYGHNAQNGDFYEVDLEDGSITKVSTAAYTFTDLASGEFSRHYDFGNRTVSNICGYKYRAGTTDGLEGWTINLFKWDETLNNGEGGWPIDPFDTTETDANGMYCFEGLYKGSYRVEEVIDDPDHWVQTFPKDGYHIVPLPAGDSPDCVKLDASVQILSVGRFYDFMNEELYDICGIKYDGETQATLAGFTIILEKEREPGVWGVITSVVTLADGKYCFERLQAGTYRVSEAFPVGDPAWIQVVPGGDGYHHVTLPGDQSDCKDETTFYNFINRAVGKINAFKFYDLNANGVFDEGVDLPIQGWKIRLYNNAGLLIDTRYTGVDGKVTFEPLFIGSYTVREVMPFQTCWMATTDLEAVMIVTRSSDETAMFGNLCLGYGGGHTLGFWSNKNGQALIGSDDLAMLRALNLVRADGSVYDPLSKTNFRNWLLSAKATNMAYMLSTQLAAMELNVFNNMVDGDALIYAPGTMSANALGFASVNDVMAEANAELLLHPVTLDGSPFRAYQEKLKNALDNANNNRTFVQATPCAITYPPEWFYHWTVGFPYGATPETFAVAMVTGAGMEVWWYSDGSLIATGWYHDIYSKTTVAGYDYGEIATWNEPVKELFGLRFPGLTHAWYFRTPVTLDEVPPPQSLSVLID